MPPRSGRSFQLSVRTRLIFFTNPSLNNPMPVPSLRCKLLISFVTLLGLLWQPGRVASCMPVVVCRQCLTLPHPKLLIPSLWSSYLGEEEAKKTCRRAQMGTGAMQALDRRGFWRLALQSPKHGVLVTPTCSVWAAPNIPPPLAVYPVSQK